ncbi:30S ribosome-binding factor RbfA [Parvibaculaceae bacterium PLY_AMNH_Bact1]|nr:30S ribosome-binding factor RbfA [Parvibaculaceae bacterium PLY_AMNH_Bact1]
MSQRRKGTIKAPSGRAPSQRQLRIGELLRAALSEIFTRRDVLDPVLREAIITVSEVRASPDLKNAVAYVVPLGHDDPTSVVDALNKAKRFFRGEVSRAVTLKHMPDLTFAADTTFDYAESVDAMLSSPNVARDLKDPAFDPESDPESDIGGEG